jgi:iron-sulfur cluster repair protein YtfE (RIC family)
MTEQHMEIDALLAVLLPQWEMLRADGSRLGWMPADFERDSEKLQEVLESHLSMEEETVFPAMRRDLSAESEAVILREMRERRALRGLEMPAVEEAVS